MSNNTTTTYIYINQIVFQYGILGTLLLFLATAYNSVSVSGETVIENGATILISFLAIVESIVSWGQCAVDRIGGLHEILWRRVEQAVWRKSPPYFSIHSVEIILKKMQDVYWRRDSMMMYSHGNGIFPVVEIRRQKGFFSFLLGLYVFISVFVGWLIHHIPRLSFIMVRVSAMPVQENLQFLVLNYGRFCLKRL